MEKLYMLAIMPPPDLSRKIDNIRKEFAEAYNCKAALKPPVHLTLYPPFHEEEDDVQEIATKLKRWSAGQKPFQLSITGFDAFKNNGVIYLALAPSVELKQLHKELVTHVNKIVQPVSKPSGFNPHITIGYRDIPKELFLEALKDYLPRKFKANFKADRVCLWRHTGARWETIDEFFLGGENPASQQSLF